MGLGLQLWRWCLARRWPLAVHLWLQRLSLELLRLRLCLWTLAKLWLLAVRLWLKLWALWALWLRLCAWLWALWKRCVGIHLHLFLIVL